MHNAQNYIIRVQRGDMTERRAPAQPVEGQLSYDENDQTTTSSEKANDTKMGGWDDTKARMMSNR